MRGLIERHVTERQSVILLRLLKAIFHPETPEICQVFLFQVCMISLAVPKSALCPPFHIDML